MDLRNESSKELDFRKLSRELQHAQSGIDQGIRELINIAETLHRSRIGSMAYRVQTEKAALERLFADLRRELSSAAK